MPINPTYPGVYVQEIPSGVRTIMGVSTSVTAFAGSARSGPINKAIHILSYSDFERRFGGLSNDSEMSYAVRQFFSNGGSDAWVVRVAKNAAAATRTLQNSTSQNVLQITALDEGKTGNAIEVRVDYKTGNFASTFNLALGDETYLDLSMNSNDARYVEDIVNGASQLAEVKRVHNLAGLSNGTSISGLIGDVTTLLDANHNQLRISVNGSQPVTVQIDLPITGADPSPLVNLCAALKKKVQDAANGNAALSGFLCATNTDENRIMMTSGEAGEKSSVRVLAGLRNDASGRLMLGTINGGQEADAVSVIRPAEAPERGTLASGDLTLADLTGPPVLPSMGNSSFYISLDGYGPDIVDIDTTPTTGTIQERLKKIAGRIETKVRSLKTSNPSYMDFTCTVPTASNNLILTSGSRGTGSTVIVNEVTGDGLADGLKLLSDANRTPGINITLQGGNEDPFTDAEAYNIYIASRADRKGIYALESVDIFNLFCLPGVTDGGILADADSYCQERRAFMIIDAPHITKKPSEMVTVISGTALPKSDHAAVYYPWIRIADPLKGGKLRSCSPGGTVAGLYARTDSARGVWKAPAGTDATLVGVKEVEYLLTDMENGTLNPLGSNCIRIFPVFGAVAWGARTLRGADQMASEYKYIPIRRLALFIEESLFRGTKWVVFEPNDEPLWSQIRLNLGAFMHSLFRQGAFQGQTPKEAYFVKCDKETTTQDDINKGIVNIVVGFAPLKPAEFVIIQIQQIAGHIQT